MLNNRKSSNCLVEEKASHRLAMTAFRRAHLLGDRADDHPIKYETSGKALSRASHCPRMKTCTSRVARLLGFSVQVTARLGMQSL